MLLPAKRSRRWTLFTLALQPIGFTPEWMRNHALEANEPGTPARAAQDAGRTTQDTQDVGRAGRRKNIATGTMGRP